MLNIHYRGWSLLLIFFFVACSTVPELQLGEELEQQEDWDGAIAAYQEVLKQDPFNKEVEKKIRTLKSRSAEQHFFEGRHFLQEKNIAQALQEFQIALGLDPIKPEYHTALNDTWRLKNARQNLQDAKQLEGLGRFDDALTLYESAVELDPSLAEALEGITRVVEQQRDFQTIGGSAEPVTLRFQNTRLKQVFEILARTANIDILFDKDVRDDLVTIFTKDTPFDDALKLILTTNQLFAKRAGTDRLLIIPDTKQKREQYEDLQIRTFYLSNSKAKDMANLLRTILETKRVYVNEPLNTVVVRDQPAKIDLAEHIILANDRQDAEVVFEVEVLEVNRTKTQNLGLNFAKQAGVGVFPDASVVGDAVGQTVFSTLPQTFTYRNLTNLGKDSFLLQFPSSVLLDFFKQESDAKTLANPRLRVLNNEKASINIGDKQPILLSTTNVLPGQATTGVTPTTSTVTSIEFKDTGIKLTVEPIIHLNNAITLRLQIEVTRLGDRVILQADPLISQFRFGTRTADTALSMRDGETVVLAGLIQEEDRRTREAVPYIDDIPGLGDLLSNKDTEKVTTEVVLVITPHIVRSLNTPQLAKQTLWSGTAKQYDTKPLFSHNQPVPTALYQENGLPSSQFMEAKKTVQEPSEQQSDGFRIQVVPTTTSAKVGEEIQVTLQADDVVMIGQSSLSLSYDPEVVTFKEVREGPFWRAQDIPPSLTVSAVPKLGQIVMQMGQEGKPAHGSGPLATVIFEATGTGSSNIQLQNPTVMGPDAQPVSVVVQHGSVQVE